MPLVSFKRTELMEIRSEMYNLIECCSESIGTHLSEEKFDELVETIKVARTIYAKVSKALIIPNNNNNKETDNG